MLEFVTLQNCEELDDYVMHHPKGHYLQTSLWGAGRTDRHWDGILCRENGKIVGVIALLSRQLGGMKDRFYHAPRGPIYDEGRKDVFETLCHGAAEFAKKNHGYILRIDPQVAEDDVEFRAMAEGCGFTIDPISDFAAFSPRMVYQLKLAGRTEEEVLTAMHQKTRYNIRLAAKKGVAVRLGTKEDLPAFCEMMAITAEKDGFHGKDQQYFADLMDGFNRGGKDYLRLYMAYLDEEPLAGTIAISCCNKTWFLNGCSSASHHNLMAPYLLQWEMIRWGIANGSEYYDFRGVEGYPTEDNPKYGLHRYKAGFGAEFVTFMGQMDWILRPVRAKLLDAAIAIKSKLH